MTDLKVTTEETLESLVDKIGLQSVLESLVCICYMKANHLEGNWQDKNQAGDRSRAAQLLLKAENAVPPGIIF